MTTVKQSMRAAAVETLISLAQEYPDLVVLDADVSRSTGTLKFAEKFPERFIEAGIAEQNCIGMAAGIASTGKLPFAMGYAAFFTSRAADQIRVSVAYGNQNVKIIATHGGLDVGPDGPTHQAIEDIAIMRAMPNMRVYSPGDAVETRAVIEACARDRGPAYIRLPRSETPVIEEYDRTDWELGKASVLKEGRDVLIVATGVMLFRALEAQKILEAEGVSAGLVNVHSIKPLDVRTILDAARGTAGILVVEDHNVFGGLGGAVAEAVSELEPQTVIRMGVQDRFAESDEADALFEKYGLNPASIARRALALAHAGSGRRVV